MTNNGLIARLKKPGTLGAGPMCCLLLTGCIPFWPGPLPEILTVKKQIIPMTLVENSVDRVVLRFEPTTYLRAQQTITRLHVFKGYPKSFFEDNQALWCLESVDGKPVRVHEVVYGIVPPGFRETRPAAPLKADDEIIVWAWRDPSSLILKREIEGKAHFRVSGPKHD